MYKWVYACCCYSYEERGRKRIVGIKRLVLVAQFNFKFPIALAAAIASGLNFASNGAACNAGFSGIERPFANIFSLFLIASRAQALTSGSPL